MVLCPASYVCSSTIRNEHECRAGKAFVIIKLPCVNTAARKMISLIFSWAGRTQKPSFYTNHLHIASEITCVCNTTLQNTQKVCNKCEEIIGLNLGVTNMVSSLFVTHV